jgi:hypothetical protein
MTELYNAFLADLNVYSGTILSLYLVAAIGLIIQIGRMAWIEFTDEDERML